ncbi:MAG: glycosyltransferase family 39 protein [Acidobacteriota bacterium]|nr:glycosyltransferase family 39 protein [Acidobacteriota bacterium]MDQ7087083.1 glycosyltransferase family 39 protein [Acidobacteriota bacterium]
MKSTGRGLVPVLVALAILGPSVPGRELLPPDEPRFAWIAQQMMQSGDWLLPRYDGALYLDKPPLLLWLQALAAAGGGLGREVAARWASLAATAGLVLLVYHAGRRWYDETTGFLAALILPSSLLVLERGAWGSTDALLACWVFVALWAADGIARRPRAAPFTAGLATGLGVLTKGPVALLLVALAVAAGLPRRSEGPSWRVFVHPLFILGLGMTVAPWVVAVGLRAGWEVFAQAAWHHSGDRFLHSWDNIEPWWYHLENLFTGFFPWSLATIGALWPAFARRRLADRRSLWLALWLALALIVFSLPAGKRGVYLLPLYPALALLAARALPALAAWAPGRRLGGGLLLGVGLLALGVGAWILLPAAGSPLPPAIASLPAVHAAAAGLMLTLAACLGLGGALALPGRAPLWAGPLAFAIATGALWPPLLGPAVNQAQGARRLGREVRATLPAGARVGITPNKRDLVRLYALPGARLLADPDAVARHLASDPRALALGPAEELGPPRSWPPGTRILWTTRLGRDHLLLVGRPAVQ